MRAGAILDLSNPIEKRHLSTGETVGVYFSRATKSFIATIEDANENVLEFKMFPRTDEEQNCGDAKGAWLWLAARAAAKEIK